MKYECQFISKYLLMRVKTIPQSRMDFHLGDGLQLGLAPIQNVVALFVLHAQ